MASKRGAESGAPGTPVTQDLFSWAESREKPREKPRQKVTIKPSVIETDRSRNYGSRRGGLGDMLLISDLKINRSPIQRQNRVRRNRVLLVLVVIGAIIYTIIKITR